MYRLVSIYKLALFVFLIVPVSAQSQDFWTQEPVGRGEEEVRALIEMRKNGEWLAAIELANRYRSPKFSQLAQSQAFLYSWVGRNDFVRRMEEEGMLGAFDECQLHNIANGQSSQSSFLNDIEGQRIVVINEAHWKPMHRGLLIQLLPALYDMGFRYFAVEDIKRGKRHNSIEEWQGFHSDLEPVFSQLMRDALMQGFNIVDFETLKHPRDFANPSDFAKDREHTMAQNLMERVFGHDKDAKVLVFVGFNRVYEEPLARHNHYKMMTAHLKELSGLDPYTIDQVECVDKKMAGLHVDGAEEGRNANAIVMGGAYGYVDRQVRHGYESSNSIRSSWLKSIGRQEVDVLAQLNIEQRPILIEAHFVDAPRAGTIADRLFLDARESAPLLLQTGTYTLKVYGKNGEEPETIKEAIVEVAN